MKRVGVAALFDSYSRKYYRLDVDAQSKSPLPGRAFLSDSGVYQGIVQLA